jgi:hypothetical protein
VLSSSPPSLLPDHHEVILYHMLPQARSKEVSQLQTETTRAVSQSKVYSLFAECPGCSVTVMKS